MHPGSKQAVYVARMPRLSDVTYKPYGKHPISARLLYLHAPPKACMCAAEHPFECCTTSAAERMVVHGWTSSQSQRDYSPRPKRAALRGGHFFPTASFSHSASDHTTRLGEMTFNPAPDPYRLPLDVKPVHYDVTVRTDLEKLTFSGFVRVRYVQGLVYILKASEDIIIVLMSKPRPHRSFLIHRRSALLQRELDDVGLYRKHF